MKKMIVMLIILNGMSVSLFAEKESNDIVANKGGSDVIYQ
jgi:hypothetical protein